MPKLVKSLLACAVAAFLPCFLFMEWQDYSMNSYLPWSRGVQIIMTPDWSMIAYLFVWAFFVMAAVGLPLAHRLLTSGRQSVLWYLGLSVLVTTALLVILCLPALFMIDTLAKITMADFAMTFEASYLPATVAIVIFWLIRRPDKDIQVCEIKDPASCT